MNPIEPSASQSFTSAPEFENRTGPGDTAKQKVRRAAGQALDQTKGKLASAAGQGKDAAAGRVAGYSDRLRDAARSAEEEDPNIAQLAHSAADRLQRAADYMREADFRRLREDAADLAHRHPALFTGGMFVAGLVLGGLAKASVQSLRDDTGRSGEGDNGYYSEQDAEARYTAEGANEPLGSVAEAFNTDSQSEPRL